MSFEVKTEPVDNVEVVPSGLRTVKVVPSTARLNGIVLENGVLDRSVLTGPLDRREIEIKFNPGESTIQRIETRPSPPQMEPYEYYIGNITPSQDRPLDSDDLPILHQIEPYLLSRNEVRTMKMEQSDSNMWRPWTSTVLPLNTVTLVKTESVTGTDSNPARPIRYRNRIRKAYQCRICLKTLKSKHEFHIHIRKHKPKCHDCNLDFKKWDQYNKHLPFCSRKNGIVQIRERKSKTQKKPKTPFSCQLCYRKYEKYEHLFDHQVNRCHKRYVSPAWIVKI